MDSACNSARHRPLSSATVPGTLAGTPVFGCNDGTKSPRHKARDARNETAGTWVVRVADGAGGNSTKAIGAADDFAEADGKDVLDFWQAQDRARTIAPTIARVGGVGDAADSRPATIASALDRYEADLKIRGGDAGNVARVRAHLPDTLAKKSVA